MLLDPPGWPGCAQWLPHWPYLQAVDQALTGRGIPPGAVCIDRAGRAHGDTMSMDLSWDVSRTAGPGGLRFHWDEDTGLAYAHRRVRRGVGPGPRGAHCDRRVPAVGPVGLAPFGPTGLD
ncbi:hypothetical protein GCM10018775_92670 [Streptomyces umbrinus]|nr:hypothetical protein GCM10018775_92670 [Streptomyces umbrinus]